MHETHAVALRKEREMDTLRDAFGLKAVTEGDAFNRELQENKRAEERAARDKAQEEVRARGPYRRCTKEAGDWSHASS